MVRSFLAIPRATAVCLIIIAMSFARAQHTRDNDDKRRQTTEFALIHHASRDSEFIRPRLRYAESAKRGSEWTTRRRKLSQDSSPATEDSWMLVVPDRTQRGRCASSSAIRMRGVVARGVRSTAPEYRTMRRVGSSVLLP